MPTKTRRTRKSLESTAYHEAGHAVIAVAEHILVKHVTIRPGGDAWGHISRRNLIENDEDRLQRYLPREIRVMLAGLAAEWRFTGRNNFRGASADFNAAVDLAIRVYRPKTAGHYLKFMTSLMKDVVSVPANWCRITAVAEALLERETLTGREVRELYRGSVLDRERTVRVLREIQDHFEADDE
jgi:ATP-dependent Zn protease